MCCITKNDFQGTFQLKNIAEVVHEHKDAKGSDHHHVHKQLFIQGTLDLNPKNFTERALRFFQNVEKWEKTIEAFDESYHLVSGICKIYMKQDLFLFVQNLHEAGHHIEHTLHSFCFIGDLVRMYAGKFVEYKEGDGIKKVSYIRTSARIVHTVSHFFASAELLTELKICTFGALEPFFKYKSALSAVGYGLWTTSLIWRHFKYTHLKNDNFISDLAIHFGGCVFEGLSFAKRLRSLAKISTVLAKISSTAGIIHAWSISKRLGSNQENVEIKIDRDIIESTLGLAKSEKTHNHRDVKHHKHPSRKKSKRV